MDGAKREKIMLKGTLPEYKRARSFFNTYLAMNALSIPKMVQVMFYNRYKGR